MRIEVLDTTLAYEIRLASPDRSEFDNAVAWLKTLVPANCRNYNRDGRYWHIERRAGRALQCWLASMTDAGALDRLQLAEQSERESMQIIADAWRDGRLRYIPTEESEAE